MRHELNAINRMLKDWITIRADNNQKLIEGRINHNEYIETGLLIRQAFNSLLGHKQAILNR